MFTELSFYLECFVQHKEVHLISYQMYENL